MDAKIQILVSDEVQNPAELTSVIYALVIVLFSVGNMRSSAQVNLTLATAVKLRRYAV